jgi:hypothetical protein
MGITTGTLLTQEYLKPATVPGAAASPLHSSRGGSFRQVDQTRGTSWTARRGFGFVNDYLVGMEVVGVHLV